MPRLILHFGRAGHKCTFYYHGGHNLLFLRLVPSSGVVVRHLSFQSHHFHVSVHSIPSPCSRSSACFLGGFIYSICLQTCSSGCRSTCPNHSSRISVTLLDIFATPDCSSCLLVSDHVTPHIHHNILSISRG